MQLHLASQINKSNCSLRPGTLEGAPEGHLMRSTRAASEELPEAPVRADPIGTQRVGTSGCECQSGRENKLGNYSIEIISLFSLF